MNRFSAYLPSKKFSHVVGAIILVVILFFVVRHFWNKEGLSTGQLTIEKIAVQAAIEKDTDGDTIPDWEEVLWGTNPQATQTYNVPDVTYIESKKKASPSVNSTTDGADTENDTFSKEFLATFASLAASNSLTKENIEQLAQKYSKEVAGNAADIKSPYVPKDLTGGKDTLSNYRKKLQSTLDSYVKKGIGNELAVIQKNINEDGTIITGPIKTLGVTYTELGSILIKMSVPPEMAAAHLSFANNAAIMGSILTSFSVLDTDSFTAIVAFSHYPKASENFYRDLETIVKILTDNGIIK